MDKMIILQQLRKLKPILQQNYGLSEIALFGSYSRDEQTRESDIDIMVDFSSPIGIEYFNLVYTLNDAFKNCKVQVVSKKGLNKNTLTALNRTYYMPNSDDDLLISDMIECCVNIFEYTNGMNSNNFINDRKTVDAVIRNFEVLSEACKRVSEDLRSTNTFIEWKKISDFRNILVHQYFGINYEIMWKIIEEYLPQQYEYLKQLAAKFSE